MLWFSSDASHSWVFQIKNNLFVYPGNSTTILTKSAYSSGKMNFTCFFWERKWSYFLRWDSQNHRYDYHCLCCHCKGGKISDIVFNFAPSSKKPNQITNSKRFNKNWNLKRPWLYSTWETKPQICGLYLEFFHTKQFKQLICENCPGNIM